MSNLGYILEQRDDPLLESAPAVSSAVIAQPSLLVRFQAKFLGAQQVQDPKNLGALEESLVALLQRQRAGKDGVLTISAKGIRFRKQDQKAEARYGMHRVVFSTSHPQGAYVSFVVKDKHNPRFIAHSFACESPAEADRINKTIGEAFRLAYTFSVGDEAGKVAGQRFRASSFEEAPDSKMASPLSADLDQGQGIDADQALARIEAGFSSQGWETPRRMSASSRASSDVQIPTYGAADAAQQQPRQQQEQPQQPPRQQQRLPQPQQEQQQRRRPQQPGDREQQERLMAAYREQQLVVERARSRQPAARSISQSSQLAADEDLGPIPEPPPRRVQRTASTTSMASSVSVSSSAPSSTMSTPGPSPFRPMAAAATRGPPVALAGVASASGSMVRCLKCGALLSFAKKFCIQCGTRLGSTGSDAALVPAPAPASGTCPASRSAPEPELEPEPTPAPKPDVEVEVEVEVEEPMPVPPPRRRLSAASTGSVPAAALEPPLSPSPMPSPARDMAREFVSSVPLAAPAVAGAVVEAAEADQVEEPEPEEGVEEAVEQVEEEAEGVVFAGQDDTTAAATAATTATAAPLEQPGNGWVDGDTAAQAGDDDTGLATPTSADGGYLDLDEPPVSRVPLGALVMNSPRMERAQLRPATPPLLLAPGSPMLSRLRTNSGAAILERLTRNLDRGDSKSLSVCDLRPGLSGVAILAKALYPLVTVVFGPGSSRKLSEWLIGDVTGCVAARFETNNALEALRAGSVVRISGARVEAVQGSMRLVVGKRAGVKVVTDPEALSSAKLGPVNSGINLSDLLVLPQ